MFESIKCAKIAKKLCKDEEYLKFLVDGIKQEKEVKFQDEGKLGNMKKDFSYVEKGDYIACVEYNQYEHSRFYASCSGCIAYNFKDENLDKYADLVDPVFANIHHKDYVFYFNHKTKINKIMLKMEKWTYDNHNYYVASDGLSSFVLEDPHYSGDFGEYTICFQKLLNQSNHHSGNIKIVLRFSNEERKYYKMCELEPNISFDANSGLSDFKQTCKILDDPDSGEYNVIFEIYELCENKTWILRCSNNLGIKNWKSRKQRIAEVIDANPTYVEKFDKETAKFYKENMVAIQELRDKKVQLQKEQNQIEESTKDREALEKNNRANLYVKVENLHRSILQIENMIDENKSLLESLGEIEKQLLDIQNFSDKTSILNELNYYKELCQSIFTELQKKDCKTGEIRHMNKILELF